MILQDKITIRVTPNSRLHYLNMGYNCSNYEYIDVSIFHLPSGSNIEIEVCCDICSKENRKIKYNKFYKNTKGHTIPYSCKSCSNFKSKKTKLEKYGNENYQNVDKIKKTKLEKYNDPNYTNRLKYKTTCLERYGVDNTSKLDSSKIKRKSTNIEKYGVDNVFKSKDIKDKISSIIKQKYGTDKYITSEDFKEKYKIFCKSLGVNHFSETDEFKIKFRKTCLVNWGFKTNLLSPEIINKIKITNIEKYGFDSAMKNIDISLINTTSLIEGRSAFYKSLGYNFISYDYNNRVYKLERDECGHIFEISHDLFRSRIKYNNNSCLICYPKGELVSIKEKDVVEFISSLSDKYILNSRNLIDGKEIDIYLPDYKLGIEFNGLYWHSDKFKEKTYHYNKTLMCKKNDIHLLHIWEDDWVNKNDIIKSIIKNKMSKITTRIFARKCSIVEVSNSISNKFLDDNHIQGGTNASRCLALMFNNEIVSIMTFGKRRINSKSETELIRFCNKINTIVIGSSSKLFNYFIKNNNFERIVSYSDQSIFDGGMYLKLGFTNYGETSLNYYWSDLNKRYHRFNFNKKKLIELGYDPNKTEDQIMREIGYYKIWSCGQIRWEYNKQLL
jgi:hypothetical protein